MVNRNALFIALVLLSLGLLVGIIHLSGSEELAFFPDADVSGNVQTDSRGLASNPPSGNPTDATASEIADTGKADEKNRAKLKGRYVSLLSMLFSLCGSLGATLHALGSLAAFAGNEKFHDSWTLWYLAQPLRGAILALGAFWLIQGGLLGGIGDRNQVPVNTIAMMGATFLVGLFSDPALEKLRETFLVLFRTSEKPRKDTLGEKRKPVISAVKFKTDNPLIVAIDGQNFGTTDIVKVNATNVPVISRTDRSIEVQLNAALGTPGMQLDIVVQPTQSGAEASNVYSAKAP